MCKIDGVRTIEATWSTCKEGPVSDECSEGWVVTPSSDACNPSQKLLLDFGHGPCVWVPTDHRHGYQSVGATGECGYFAPVAPQHDCDGLSSELMNVPVVKRRLINRGMQRFSIFRTSQCSTEFRAEGADKQASCCSLEWLQLRKVRCESESVL